MARSYTFSDLVMYSGASKNEVTNWVQKNLIRPDVKATAGTGDHRTFGFLDVFEACVARKLNQIPGGIPLATLDTAFAAIRAETEIGVWESGWQLFVDPERRVTTAGVWLCRFPDGVARVLSRQACEALLTASPDALVMVRLDTLLRDLEDRTQDHATPAERANTFRKRDAATTQAVIEAAIARELRMAGLADQVETVVAQLHAKLQTLRPELRASATFVRFVELVDGIVAITGPGPNYSKWRRDVTTFMVGWKKAKKHTAPLDHRLLVLVAAREAERAAREGNARR